MEMLQKKIDQLVAENHQFAASLYHLGIPFYDYRESTLQEACDKRGLKLENVVKHLEQVYHIDHAQLPNLTDYPLDLIVEYLKHSHYLFIKKDLPFINQLILHTDALDKPYLSMINDLKEVFPYFLEDFVQHIYDEEDSLFSYIHLLYSFKKGQAKVGEVFIAMRNTSIQQFAFEHRHQDDEMIGIRSITNDYKQPADADLEVKVLFNELQDFEKRLQIHAGIENNILLPKALQLEGELKVQYSELARVN